ncbi:OmpA family protein [Porphyrobacter sp. ULC335]|uniref:OmpA family protein n=1 Tax=Porphyrobacter sp. ULC335 TaxID=2854260 RepID=UPI00221E5A57|nr:OmpA family protein [Porphyrobacter sp. ULC335]UYV14936.1 OmpA family protein [Porphyrobacter sp. ULC335]
MKNTAFLMAGAAMIIAVPAHAREGQPYIGINGGVILDDQVRINIDSGEEVGPVQTAAIANTNLGIDGDLVIGYDFGPFRLEAEGGYKRAGYESLQVLNSAILPGGITVPPGTLVQNESDLEIWSGMVNAMVEFGSDDGFQIFGGGGVGVARMELPVNVPTVGTVIDDKATDFAWQLIGGVRLAVTDNVDLGVKYRYFVADNFDFQAANGRGLTADYSAHSVLASLTYNFGGRAQPEPAPVMAPPPPPPVMAPPPPRPVAPPPPPRPACNTGPYIVFFDFDRSDISPEASSILNNAVTAYANCGTARVMLAGHTDSSGGAQYNMALAERRNGAVRSYMTSRGVPAGQISGEAFGESQPRVPTADGVREAQNRRVEVTYGPGSGM